MNHEHPSDLRPVKRLRRIYVCPACGLRLHAKRGYCNRTRREVTGVEFVRVPKARKSP